MTTPPHGESPEDSQSDSPQAAGDAETAYQLPPAYLPPPAHYPDYGSAPPPDYRHYGPPPTPGYPYQQGRPPPPASRISIGMVFAGCALWAIVNVFVALAAIVVSAGAASGSDNVIFGVAAVGLVGVAFGVGGGLLATRNRHAKGLGLGLMIGWALTSLLTVGVCTGINPGMYSL